MKIKNYTENALLNSLITRPKYIHTNQQHQSHLSNDTNKVFSDLRNLRLQKSQNKNLKKKIREQLNKNLYLNKRYFSEQVLPTEFPVQTKKNYNNIKQDLFHAKQQVNLLPIIQKTSTYQPTSIFNSSILQLQNRSQNNANNTNYNVVVSSRIRDLLLKKNLTKHYQAKQKCQFPKVINIVINQKNSHKTNSHKRQQTEAKSYSMNKIVIKKCTNKTIKGWNDQNAGIDLTDFLFQRVQDL